MRGPDFLGIGAQRSGSTWLHRMLSKHPQVWMTPIKELHYFDDPKSERWREHLAKRRAQKGFPTLWDARYFLGRRNDEWYSGLFAGKQRRGFFTGEITPAYAIVGDTEMARIKRINPSVKLIYSMRDPIERAWSAYRNSIAKGRASTGDLEGFLTNSLVFRHSDYWETITRIESHFEPSAIHYCFFEDLISDPQTYAVNVLQFLALETDGADTILPQSAVNSAPQTASIPLDLSRAIAQRLTPSFERLAERFGGHTIAWRDRLRELNN